MSLRNLDQYRLERNESIRLGEVDLGEDAVLIREGGLNSSRATRQQYEVLNRPTGSVLSAAFTYERRVLTEFSMKLLPKLD